jgi:hypothetical protein
MNFRSSFPTSKLCPKTTGLEKLLAGGLKWNCLSEVDEAPIAFLQRDHRSNRVGPQNVDPSDCQKVRRTFRLTSGTVLVARIHILTNLQCYRDFTDCFVEANIKLRVEPARTDLKRDENIQFNRQWNVPWNVNFPNPRAHTIVQSGMSISRSGTLF